MSSKRRRVDATRSRGQRRYADEKRPFDAPRGRSRVTGACDRARHVATNEAATSPWCGVHAAEPYSVASGALTR